MRTGADLGAPDNCMFITLYGINNIGKTYHAKRLVERLKKTGKRAVFLKYPIYDEKPSGPFLNAVLRGKGKQKISEEELQLWFVLNRYQFEPKLRRLLASGTHVVAEDYTGTGIAWGIAKGAKQSELEIMNKFLVQPDRAILLDGERKLFAREKKHLHEQNDSLSLRTQNIFRKLAKKYGWKVVRVDEDRDVTAARLWQAISKY